MGSQHSSREEVFSQGVQKNGPSPTDLKEALPSERAGEKKAVTSVTAAQKGHRERVVPSVSPPQSSPACFRSCRLTASNRETHLFQQGQLRIISRGSSDLSDYTR